MCYCPDCGGSGGNRYNDCSYDGTGGRHYGGPGSVLGIQILIGIATLLGLRYPDIGANYDCRFCVEGDTGVDGPFYYFCSRYFQNNLATYYWKS